MILYTQNGDKVRCSKCDKPKLYNEYFDFFLSFIDDKVTRFWFSLKNNGSNFYFKIKDDWYRTPISTEDYDLFVLLYDMGEKLLTERKDK